MSSRAFRAPRTALLTATSLAAWALPGAGGALEYSRLSVRAGEVWRLLSGHLAHWSTEHLLYSLGTTALLGLVLERRRPALMAWTVALSAALVSAALWLGAPQTHTYRGLSGVGCALFAALLIDRGADLARARRWGPLAAAIALGAAMATKLTFELTTGDFLFVGGGPFTPAPIAHAAGLTAGLITGLRAARGARQGRRRAAICPLRALSAVSPENSQNITPPRSSAIT